MCGLLTYTELRARTCKHKSANGTYDLQTKNELFFFSVFKGTNISAIPVTVSVFLFERTIFLCNNVLEC